MDKIKELMDTIRSEGLDLEAFKYKMDTEWKLSKKGNRYWTSPDGTFYTITQVQCRGSKGSHHRANYQCSVFVKDIFGNSKFTEMYSGSEIDRYSTYHLYAKYIQLFGLEVKEGARHVSHTDKGLDLIDSFKDISLETALGYFHTYDDAMLKQVAVCELRGIWMQVDKRSIPYLTLQNTKSLVHKLLFNTGGCDDVYKLSEETSMHAGRIIFEYLQDTLKFFIERYERWNESEDSMWDDVISELKQSLDEWEELSSKLIK